MLHFRLRPYALLLLVFTLGTLSGCGGGDDSPAASSTGVADSTPNAMDPAASAAGMPEDMGAHSEEPGAAMGTDMASDDMAGMEAYVDTEADMAAEYEAQMEGTDSGDPAMVSSAGGTMGASTGQYDESQYEEAYAGQLASQGGAGNPNTGMGQVKSSRPADVAVWSDTELLEAVSERDATVLLAIEFRAEAAQGDPAFAGLMNQVLVANAGGSGGYSPPIPGEPGFPRDYDPNAAPGPGDARPVPPGGASLQRRPSMIPALNERAVTSLETMFGQALMAYVPQATQASRGAAENLQSRVGSMQPGSVSGSPTGAPQSKNGPPGQMSQGSPEMSEYASEMAEYGSQGPGNNPGSTALGQQQRPAGNLTDEELLGSVAKALIVNNTDSAWKTLSAILKGRVPSPLSKEQIVQILVTSVSEAVALNAEAAEKLLSSGVMTTLKNADESELMKLLTVVGGAATDHFLRLSEVPAESSEAEEGTDGTTTAGSPNSSRSEMMAGSMSEEGEMEYDGGEEAYGGFQGMVAGAQQPTVAMGLPTVNVSQAALPPIAVSLWSPASVDAIATHLDNADASASLDLLALATVIPSEKVRHSVYQLFLRLHEQGAAAMVQSGLFSGMAKDPGLLTVLKALPRSRGQRTPTRLNTATIDPKESWSDASLDVVLSLRDRLQSVESNPDLRFDGRQPVPLHDRNIIPEVAIAIESLPADADALGDAKPAPTKIYYTRLAVSFSAENLRDMRDVAEHYERRSNGLKHELQSRGLLWYDGVKKGADGSRQSMDVIIQQAKSAPAAFNQAPAANTIGGSQQGSAVGVGGQRFTIDIIVVNTRDPKEAPEKAAVAVR